MSKSHVVACGLLFAAASRLPTGAAEPTVLPTYQQLPEIRVSADEPADDPDRYYGKRVTVTGDVEDVYSRSLFSVDQHKRWSTGRDLLVLNPNAAGRVNQDSTVTVSGVVRPFEQARMDRYIAFHGWQWDFSTLDGRRFNMRPVIVADSILAPSNRQLVMNAAAVRASAEDYGKAVGNVQSVQPSGVVYTTPNVLSEYAERFYGKTVSIIGTREDAFGTQLFSIDEDPLWSTGKEVLVLARGINDGWESLSYVQIQGKVMRFAKDEVQKGIDGDRTIALSFWQDFENRPLLIADSVRGPEGRNLMPDTKGR